MNFDFNSLKFDKSTLFNIKNINPDEIFKMAGIKPGDTNKILKGDYSPILNEYSFIVDYEILQKNYGAYFNDNLIKYFFQKKKRSENFTEEENFLYKEAYDFFFNLIFRIAPDGIFSLVEDIPNKCLVIKIEESCFILIKTQDFNRITYLKHLSEN